MGSADDTLSSGAGTNDEVEPWPYGILRNWFGHELSAEMVSIVAQMPLDQAQALAGCIIDAVPSATLPPLPSGQLRPLAGKRPLDMFRDPESYTGERLTSALALYTHQVAMYEPLSTYALQRDTLAERLPEFLSFAMDYMIKLQPLTDAGLLHWVPRPTAAVWTDNLDEDYFGRIAGIDMDTIERHFPLLWEEGYRQGYSHAALMRTGADHVETLGRELILLAKHVRNLQPLFRWRGDEQLAAYLFSQLPPDADLLSMESASGDARRSRMRTLVALAVPELIPNPKLVASLRRTSEEFGHWRTALSSALSVVDDTAADDPGVDEARAIADVELQEARARLLREVQRSPTLTAARRGIVTFSLGGLASTAAHLVGGNLPAALASGAVGAAVASAQIYIENLRRRRSGKAFLEAYLIFRSGSKAPVRIG